MQLHKVEVEMSLLSSFMKSTEVLLASGGDDRQIYSVDSAGESLNKYFCSTLARDNIIRRGSCTSTTLNMTDYLVADKYRHELLSAVAVCKDNKQIEKVFDDHFQTVIQRLKKVFGFHDNSGSEIVLFPSGSDAELLPVIVGLIRSFNLDNNNVKVFNNVIAAGEVGSGTHYAASGQHFSTVTPFGDSTAVGSYLQGVNPSHIQCVLFTPRDEAGAVDTQVEAIIAAIHQQMTSSSSSVSVIHMVYGSKTGLILPSWENICALQQQYPSRLIVVIDACQGRCELSQLRQFVENHNCFVLFTGSKYYCGPPFSGGVIIPTTAVEEIESHLNSKNDAAAIMIPSGLSCYISSHQVGSKLKRLRCYLSKFNSDYMNIGLYLRWCVALSNMEAHSLLSAGDVKSAVTAWVSSIQSLIRDYGEGYISLLDDVNRLNVGTIAGIINVVIRVNDSQSTDKQTLTLEECREFCRLLTSSMSGVSDTEDVYLNCRVMIGQPVKLSNSSVVVRIACGADVTLRLINNDNIVMVEDAIVVHKMIALAKNWSTFYTSKTTSVASSRLSAIDSTLCVDAVSSRKPQNESITQCLTAHFTSTPLPKVAVFYDLDAFDNNINLVNSAFNTLSSHYRPKHCFAVKSCPFAYILHYAVRRGCGLECASLCEVKQALKVNCSPVNIIFDCPCKTVEDIYFALSEGVTLNANSYNELSKIEQCLLELHSKGIVSKSIIGLRVNPMVGSGDNADLSTATITSKFGVPLFNVEIGSFDHKKVITTIKNAIDYTEDIVNVFVSHPFLSAIMCHVGSQGMPLNLMSLGAKRIIELADLIDERCGDDRIKLVDIGGGISANYNDAEINPTFEEYTKDLMDGCPALGNNSNAPPKNRILITEFGKGLIAKCGYITSTIEDVLYAPTSVKEATKKQCIAIGHAGADLLLRTAYSPQKFPHRVMLLNKNYNILDGSGTHASYVLSQEENREEGTVTIAGPLCFSGDIVSSNLLKFALPVVGDVCVVLDAGANTVSLFSRHCSRNFPIVYAYRGDKIAVIRERETDEELLRFWD